MKTPKDLIGCCGHDCGRCVTYLATVRGDDGLRGQAQAFFRDTFRVDINDKKPFRMMGTVSFVL